MLDFTYYAPTKVYFGKGKHKEVGAIIKGYGFKKIMIQYGKSSIKQNGVYDEVIASLRDNGIEFVQMGGVEPNPKLSFVYEAIKVARENDVEMILAVGGGSVLDSAKTTAAGVMYDGDVWDFPEKKATPDKSLPVGCVLTIAAAGSEMSSSAVITNTALHSKRGFGSDFNRCLFSICNPELTYTVNSYQTACGVVDTMSHTMERYFTVCEPTDLTDRISESLLKSVINAGAILMDDPCNYEARATVMWASSLSHNGLTDCGRENYLAVHQLEHALSGEFDHIAHGAGLAVLFPVWGRYIYRHNIPRFAQFARRVWDVTEPDDETAAAMGIEKMSEYFKSLNMPSSLHEFDIPSDCIDHLADLCTYGKQRQIKSFVSLDYDKVKEIFRSCY